MVSTLRLYHKSRLIKLAFVAVIFICLIKIGLDDLPGHHRDTVGYRQEDVTLNLHVNLDEKLEIRLPQAFILGAGKCGTATMQRFLGSHPKIVTPLELEMTFYDHHYQFSEAWHKARLRPSRSDQITLETSPGYFHDERVRDRILNMNKTAKFIVILRDPVQRAISQYVHFKRKTDNLTFEFTALNKYGKPNMKWDGISYGLYDKPMARWLEKVPLRQFYIVDGNSFVKNPLPHLRGIEQFLHLPRFFKQEQFLFVAKKGFYCLKKSGNGTASCMSKYKGRSHPPVKQSVLNNLKMFYKPHNERLFRLIGRRFDWGY